MNQYYLTFIRTSHGNYSTIPTNNRKLAEFDGETLKKELIPAIKKGMKVLYNRTITVEYFEKIWNNKYEN